MALTYGCAAAAPQGVHQARRIARQISRKMTAPMVAVIRLPQKSGIDRQIAASSNRKPPTMAPTRPTAMIAKMPPRPPRICVRQPAGDQADDDPGQMTPIAVALFRSRRLRRHAVARRRIGNLRSRPRSCRRRCRRTAASTDSARRCRAACTGWSSPARALLQRLRARRRRSRRR